MSLLHEQWQEVYSLLGLGREFREFHLRVPIMQPLHDASGLWLIPVIADVTMTKIFDAFIQKGVKVNDLIGLSQRQGLVVENSYLVYTDGGVNLPIRMAGKSEHMVGMVNVQEYFLLDLWYLIVHESCLDDSSMTVCSGTRLDGEKIPAGYYSSYNKVVEVGWFIGEVTKRCGPRLIYVP